MAANNHEHRPDRSDEQQGQDTRPIETMAGTSDGIVGNGEFLSDMERDEGDIFFEELGAAILGKDVEDYHTPDQTTDHENRQRS